MSKATVAAICALRAIPMLPSSERRSSAISSSAKQKTPQILFVVELPQTLSVLGRQSVSVHCDFGGNVLDLLYRLPRRRAPSAEQSSWPDEAFPPVVVLKPRHDRVADLWRLGTHSRTPQMSGLG